MQREIWHLEDGSGTMATLFAVRGVLMTADDGLWPAQSFGMGVSKHNKHIPNFVPIYRKSSKVSNIHDACGSPASTCMTL